MKNQNINDNRAAPTKAFAILGDLLQSASFNDIVNRGTGDPPVHYTFQKHLSWFTTNKGITRANMGELGCLVERNINELTAKQT